MCDSNDVSSHESYRCEDSRSVLAPSCSNHPHKVKDPEFADANAEVLAIAEDPDEHAIAHMKNMSIPFHILKDPGATVRTMLNIKDSPSVAVLDRYGMLLMLCSKCENANETLEDIISELLTVEMQCPECGVSSWRMDY